MRYIIKDAEQFTELKSKNRKKWIALLVSVLVVGALMALLEVLIPGTIAYFLSMIKALILAIWSMLGDVADAIGDFIQYVLKQRA